jgi:hypothetical protein
MTNLRNFRRLTKRIVGGLLNQARMPTGAMASKYLIISKKLRISSHMSSIQEPKATKLALFKSTLKILT